MTKDDVAQIVELSLLAWEPVFRSMEKVLGPRIFHLIWPDWRKMPASLLRRWMRFAAS